MAEVTQMRNALIERRLVESATRRIKVHGIHGAAYVTPEETVALVSWVERLEAHLDEMAGITEPLQFRGYVS